MASEVMIELPLAIQATYIVLELSHQSELFLEDIEYKTC